MAHRKVIIHNHRVKSRTTDAPLTLVELSDLRDDLRQLASVVAMLQAETKRGEVDKAVVTAVRRAVAALANV